MSLTSFVVSRSWASNRLRTALTVLGIAFGVAIVVTWFEWYTLLFMVPYGMLWCLGGDSRCHETGHGTAF